MGRCLTLWHERDVHALSHQLGTQPGQGVFTSQTLVGRDHQRGECPLAQGAPFSVLLGAQTLRLFGDRLLLPGCGRSP